jgi:hypothetical protein
LVLAHAFANVQGSDSRFYPKLCSAGLANQEGNKTGESRLLRIHRVGDDIGLHELPTRVTVKSDGIMPP